MESKMKLRVGSRKSQLAMIQTNTVLKAISEVCPNVSFEIVSMETIGDKILDVALPKIGMSSVFTRELEIALIAKEVDMVVHSMKDCPTKLPEGLVIGSVYRRDSPFDVVVMNPKHKDKTLSQLPEGSVIGTSSLRRIAQISKKHAHLKFESIRGNLNARLEKLDKADKYAALILAEAGLSRMGWENRISERLCSEECMYAVCQGAIGIECRQDDKDTLQILNSILDKDTALQCVAERSFIKTLGVGYKAPVSVHSQIKGNEIYLAGEIFSLDGRESRNFSISKSLLQNEDAIAQQEESEDSTFTAIVGGKYKSEMCNAEVAGIQLAEDFLNSEAKDLLMVAKLATENALLHNERE